MICLVITAFCRLFFLVYDRFSHGVRSPYMTYLFAWPLLLGFLPALVFTLDSPLPEPGRWSMNLYFSGVAAVTVSSALRGVFEIAGTASDYQQYLMIAGVVLLALGAVAYLLGALAFAGRKKAAKP